MKALAPATVHASWLALIGVTLASYWSAGHVPPAFALLTVMLLAATKAGLILVQFMEILKAQVPIRAFFAGWVAICVAIIVIFHWAAGT